MDAPPWTEGDRSRMARLVADAYARIRQLIPELAKFGVVGAIGAVIDLGGTGTLHGVLDFGPLKAKAIAVAIATVVTYIGNRFWTFRHRDNQPLLREATLFVLLNAVGLLIAEIVIAVTNYGLGYHDQIAYNVASVIGTGLGTIFRYFTYKKWVFLAPAALSQLAPPPPSFQPWPPAPPPDGFGEPRIPNGSAPSPVLAASPGARRATPAAARSAGPGRHRKRLRGPGPRLLRTVTRRVARKEHREHRGPAPRQHDPAAVDGRHGAGQGQAEPGSLGAAADAALEDPGHELGGHPLALVLDLDHHRTLRL